MNFKARDRIRSHFIIGSCIGLLRLSSDESDLVSFDYKMFYEIMYMGESRMCTRIGL